MDKMRRKPRVIIWEVLSHIAGGQRVILDITSQLKSKYAFEAIVPFEGSLANEFRKLGILVHLVPIGTYTLGQKRLTDILRFIWYTPLVLWKASKITKKADLIYANGSSVFLWSAIVGLLLRIPVIWHVHNLVADRKARLLIELCGKLPSVKRIIAVSYASAVQYPTLRHKIKVIYNGIDVSRFRKACERKMLLKKEKCVGVIADLIPQKGHRTLIKAIKLIRNQIPIKVFIVGAPRSNTKWYEKELRKLVKNLGLDEIVDFLGYRSDVSRILNVLDLLIVPSSSFEACPRVILEAYACGIPVIGSHLGGIPEIIEEGVTGFIFQAKDEKDLAMKMLFLLQDDSKLEEMRENCRKIVQEKFDIKIFSKKIEDILETAIGANVHESSNSP